MRYVVDVGGQQVQVEIDGERVLVGGEEVSARLRDLPGTSAVLLNLGDLAYRIDVARGESRGRYALSLGGWRYDAEALDERTRAIRELSAATAAPAGPAPLVAPMPGLIVSIAVDRGEPVKAGQELLILEAMKMENVLRAERDGVIEEIRIAPGATVAADQVLIAFA